MDQLFRQLESTSPLRKQQRLHLKVHPHQETEQGEAQGVGEREYRI